MKALTVSAVLACVCLLLNRFDEKVLLSQDPLFPPVDSNAPIQGSNQESPISDPNLVDPNVVDSNIGDPSIVDPNLKGDPGVQVGPNAMIPNSFSEAINEPMMGWFDWAEWDSSVELGINGSSGNSESFNVSSGFDLSRVTDVNEMRVGLKYINNKSNDVLVAHNARLTFDWEKKFGEELGGRFEPSRWSWFIKNTYYYDDFRPFDLRIALNSGFGYKLFQDEVQMFKGRFGVGASREFGGVSDEWVPEALFGIDYRRKISKRQKIDFTADYFPSWEDFTDYRVVTDFNWEFLLDAETNMSLKLNINNRYDSTPDGAKAHDIFYSLLMLWKF